MIFGRHIKGEQFCEGDFCVYCRADEIGLHGYEECEAPDSCRECAAYFLGVAVGKRLAIENLAESIL